MNYHVVWDDEAVDLLQRIYDSSGDKEGLTNTVIRVGLELRANPTEAGESRDRSDRILFKYPLVIWFRVDQQRRDVVIFDVKAMRQR